MGMHARRLIAFDPLVLVVLVTGLLAVGWFAVAPAQTQRPAIRAVLPVLTCLLAIGMWRTGRDSRITGAAGRFWRILAVGMLTYAAGMVVDLAALAVRELSGVPVADAGEIVLYPIAGVCTLCALVVFPTVAQTAIERVKIVLDGATVLLGSATLVWYFVSSKRWQPAAQGWSGLTDGLVLPAFTLVAGCVVLRILLAGASVMSRPTLACFVFGAFSAAAGIILGAEADTVSGRLGATVHVVGLSVCVVGVTFQRQVGPAGSAPLSGAAWRRPFTVLPYGAIAATMTVLIVVISDRLDYRGWAVVIGALALCAVVMARQLAALWENSRLLRHNRELARQLEHQAYHDDLTGLANRALFSEQVRQAVTRTGRNGDRTAVLFIDLDDFKVVNDSLGHQAGDQLLRGVADRLGTAVAESHTLGRLGGDEFAVLVEERAAGSQAAEGEAGDGVAQVADGIVAALDAPFRINGMQVHIRASLGVAAAADGAPGPMELLRNADIAMYAAKSSRKGGWRVFEPAMLTALVARHRLQAALVQAVERDEFVVFYQPIVNLADGSVLGTEALVRWRRPDGRLVEPGQFIGLAEETGLVTEIDRRVLALACAQVACWDAAGGDQLALHVNVSARQLHRADLVADVAHVLAESGLAPGRLTLEITESGLGGDPEAAIGRLVDLAAMGVHLAIDDFGTGYSSLAYLRRMPVDVLKIDKTFVAELAVDGYAPLAQAVVALAHTLGMQTVAEGIDQPTQVPRLQALGCRHGQGFLFAKPLPAAEMAALVHAPAGQPVTTSAR